MGTFKVKILPGDEVKEIQIPGKNKIRVNDLIKILGFTREDVVIVKNDNEILTDHDVIEEDDDVIVYTVFSGG